MRAPIIIPSTPTLHEESDGRTVCMPQPAKLRHSLEVKSDQSGTYLSTQCPDCGAWFEDGHLVGHGWV